MQRLEVSDAVRPLWWSLGVKGLIHLMVSPTFGMYLFTWSGLEGERSISGCRQTAIISPQVTYRTVPETVWKLMRT